MSPWERGGRRSRPGRSGPVSWRGTGGPGHPQAAPAWAWLVVGVAVLATSWLAAPGTRRGDPLGRAGLARPQPRGGGRRFGRGDRRSPRPPRRSDAADPRRLPLWRRLGRRRTGAPGDLAPRSSRAPLRHRGRDAPGGSGDERGRLARAHRRHSRDLARRRGLGPRDDLGRRRRRPAGGRPRGSARAPRGPPDPRRPRLRRRAAPARASPSCFAPPRWRVSALRRTPSSI